MIALPAPAQTASTATRRPHTLAEWRSGGLDYTIDKAIDVGGVVVAIFAAWLFIRFVARRIQEQCCRIRHAATANHQRTRCVRGFRTGPECWRTRVLVLAKACFSPDSMPIARISP